VTRTLPFDVDAILHDGGAVDLDFPHRQALAVLAPSMRDEARMTPAGAGAVQASLVGAVRTHVALDRLVARHPEIATTAVPGPIVITGMLRTGTTMVHNLLAQHPDLRVPALWELMNPAAPRSDATEYERLADAAQAYVEEYYRVAPDLPMIHFLDARRPDECHRLTANAFESLVYDMRYRVPSYGAWLAERDGVEAYQCHRRQLQAILWRDNGAGPVVLKCPFHLWKLRALARVYPEARIVHLHRSPTETVPSTCSLCVTVRGARSDDIDRTEIGRQWLARIETALVDADDARAGIGHGQLLDVRYADLVRDPMATMAGICAFAGVPLTAAAEAAMARYLTDNAQTKHGVHRYRPEDFGLATAELDERFAAYRDRYYL
jgi:hypothetical protein